MTDVLLQTPFHSRIAPLCRTNLWERWSGYTTVTQFYSETEEYFAIRNTASLYDISPMINYRLSGADAARVVNRLITRDIARCAVGQAFYSPWCNGAGKVIEEGTIFRLGENDFRINCAEHQLTWFEATAYGFDAAVSDVSQEIAGLALQGPSARLVLEAFGLEDIRKLRYFRLAEFEVDDLKVTVSRTGYTGDLGYELWVSPRDAEALWDRLMAAGRIHGLRPIGSRVLNTARIEAGNILINVDYVAANKALRESQARSPFGLALDWAVNFKKDHFNGRSALLAERAAGGPPKRLVGLDITGRRPATGAYLYDGKREVGQVTSAAWSPILKKNIALATVDARYAATGRKLMVDIYYLKEITQARIEATATVVEHHFFQPSRRRD